MAITSGDPYPIQSWSSFQVSRLDKANFITQEDGTDEPSYKYSKRRSRISWQHTVTTDDLDEILSHYADMVNTTWQFAESSGKIWIVAYEMEPQYSEREYRGRDTEHGYWDVTVSARGYQGLTAFTATDEAAVVADYAINGLTDFDLTMASGETASIDYDYPASGLVGSTEADAQAEVDEWESQGMDFFAWYINDGGGAWTIVKYRVEPG